MNREQQPMSCLGCGEDAAHQPSADPLAWEVAGPAQREPNTVQVQPAAPVGPAAHRARLDPSPALRERLLAELAARIATPSGEHTPRLRSGTAGELGREHIKRIIGRLGDNVQARAEPEPEAGS